MVDALDSRFFYHPCFATTAWPKIPCLYVMTNHDLNEGQADLYHYWSFGRPGLERVGLGNSKEEIKHREVIN